MSSIIRKVLPALFVSIIATPMTYASSISPGYDLFQTINGAYVDMTSQGLGKIDLKGLPLDSARLGKADTIVQRIDGIDPFDPLAGSGSVAIELVALSLQSLNPVSIFNPLTQTSSFFDIFVTLDKNNQFPDLLQPDQLPASTGTMTINHKNADGGTFSANLNVYADILATAPGADPSNPNNILMHMVAPQISLASTGTWSHTRPDGYPNDPTYPAGDFFVGAIEHNGPHPVVPVPEPSVLLLLGAGFAIMGLGHRRRSTQQGEISA